MRVLEITIPQTDYWNEVLGQFVTTKRQTLKLEHSLISISKWESKWHKPFLSKDEKTYEETVDYIRCMTITSGVDPIVYYAITKEISDEIERYIEDPNTATWFSDKTNRINRAIITSEIIYYQMIALQIPLDCEKWHLNRLLTLIKVCDIKNSSGKKMSQKEVYEQYRSLNEARKKASGSKG